MVAHKGFFSLVNSQSPLCSKMEYVESYYIQIWCYACNTCSIDLEETTQTLLEVLQILSSQLRKWGSHLRGAHCKWTGGAGNVEWTQALFSGIDFYVLTILFFEIS